MLGHRGHFVNQRSANRRVAAACAAPFTKAPIARRAWKFLSVKMTAGVTFLPAELPEFGRARLERLRSSAPICRIPQACGPGDQPDDPTGRCVFEPCRNFCLPLSPFLKLHCPADFCVSEAASNSSAIQCWRAVMFCARPRNFFTRSLADIDPPGSRTTRR
jgi:hypothetical protein